MKYINSYFDFIKEKQSTHKFVTNVLVDTDGKKTIFKQIINHFTTIDYLEEILKSNVLLKNGNYKDEKSAVSLTLNSNLPNTLGDLDLVCRIGLDRDKLSEKYKLIPYLFVPNKNKISWECIDEMEEQIREDIKYVIKYILKIDIINNKSKVEELKKLYPGLEINSVKNF